MKILVTGGCGFIGSAVVRNLINNTDHSVVNLDSMTYAATHGSVASVADDPRYEQVTCDIRDRDALAKVFETHAPDGVMHLAAESHVDRSIEGPQAFIETNVLGTFNLLELARHHELERFHHISTDEVFGSLTMDADAFTESSPYDPRSPYSASKASSDHLVRAWGETFDLPVVVTNCSNNYGLFQFPEKMMPLMILRAAANESLPVYGTGENVRDWLFVEDHAVALTLVFESGRLGETYNVGGDSERSNLDVVHAICDQVDAALGGGDRRSLIEFVRDRPGHDLRYAVDFSKLRDELGWKPSVTFDEGLAHTVAWYLANEEWWAPLRSSGATTRKG